MLSPCCQSAGTTSSKATTRLVYAKKVYGRIEQVSANRRECHSCQRERVCFSYECNDRGKQDTTKSSVESRRFESLLLLFDRIW